LVEQETLKRTCAGARWRLRLDKIIARVYDKDIGPVIGHMPAHAVTDQDVRTILNTIAARGSYGMADKTRRYIKTAFTIGMRAHNIPGLNSPDFQRVGNPVDRVPSFYDSVVGDRHLSIEEIKRFWSDTIVQATSASTGTALLLTLRTNPLRKRSMSVFTGFADCRMSFSGRLSPLPAPSAIDGRTI
jgi:hypothetical protein